MAFLDEAARRAMAAVEERFLFRRLGLPFDYAAGGGEFPSRRMAGAKEARAGLPNPSGLGSGFHFSCRNHALLFDAYLLRVELGIDAPEDLAILDRLIGGLIRLATVAPRSFLVGGLAPDGRSFYAQPRRDNHAAWAFSALRGISTAAVAPETQDKFRAIVGKWLERLRRERFVLSGVDGKPLPAAGADLAAPGPENGPFYLALLLTGAKASGLPGDFDDYARAADEDSRCRLADFSDGGALPDLLWRQTALHMLAGFDPDPERAALAKRLMAGNARRAAASLDAWRGWDASRAEPVDLDWRKFPAAPADGDPYGFVPPDSWRRLDLENAAAASLYAMRILLLAGDASLLEGAAAGMEECLAAPFWPDMIQLTALAPLAGVHARGVEAELWDGDLAASRRSPPAAEISFAARFLEPDYDERNPDKAGHRAPASGKPGEEEGHAGRRRRKRKRR